MSPGDCKLHNENLKFSILNFQFAMVIVVSYRIGMFVQQTTTTTM